MFALCRFKDGDDRFILHDKQDFKELAEQMNIEIEKEMSFEEFDKDYSFYPMLAVDDLFLRTLKPKARTTTHTLDELKISCWIKLKQEYNNIQEKKSKLSRSQRDKVIDYYTYILNLK